jgi:hypothetical protein
MAAAKDQIDNVQQSVPPHISYDILRCSSFVIIGKWVVLTRKMIQKVKSGDRQCLPFLVFRRPHFQMVSLSTAYYGYF